jgi:exopolysaccharide biosynthesis operon protein EpsL
MKYSVCDSAKIPAVILALFSPFSVSMAALDDFSPYAYARVMRDSNLFRVSGSQEAIAATGDDKKDDTIGYLGAGLKSDLKLSRQHLFLDADVARVTYDNFSDLDHTRVKGRAAWGWQAGNLWSGNLGYLYSRELASFNEDHAAVKDMKTVHTGYFDGGYQLSPDWALVGAANYIDTSYQDRNRLDRVASTGQLEAQYRNTLNTRVGVRTRYTDYDLKNDQNVGGTLVNNDYTETEISGVLYWEGSAKSSLEARLGYTMLRYNDLNDRDFNGLSGRLTYYWAITGKTKLDLAVWRETSSLYDEITTYVLSQGASLKPSWSVTRKISLEGVVSYENDDFKGEEDARNALGLDKREDDIWIYGISAKWSPRDFVSVRLGYRNENRDSTISSDDFDDNQIDAEVRFTF